MVSAVQMLVDAIVYLLQSSDVDATFLFVAVRVS